MTPMTSKFPSKIAKRVGSLFRKKSTHDVYEEISSEIDISAEEEVVELEPIDISKFKQAADDRVRKIFDESQELDDDDHEQREYSDIVVSDVEMVGIEENHSHLEENVSPEVVEIDRPLSKQDIFELDFPEEDDAGKEVAKLPDDDGAVSKFSTTPIRRKLYRPDGTEMSQHRFGQYLLEKGLVTLTQLDAASREQSVTGARIGQILVSNGLLSDEERVRAILATSSERISQEHVVRSKIPVQLLEEMQIIISAETEGTLYVSTGSEEWRVRDIIAEYYGPNMKVEFVSFDPNRLAGFISQMNRTAHVVTASAAKENMFNRILYRALGDGASDIHIIPRRSSYSIMFRILGVRRIIHEGPLDEYNTMLAQVKDRSSMDLAEKRKPQDGGFNIEYAGKGIDFRVATNPTTEGEVVVLRVLDPDRVHPSLDQLGITDITKWRKGFHQQHGLCLICGPTGSGKTTTLNSSIREIDRFEKSIYTIEDPVEYRIPYVTQVSVNLSVGLTFANAIRAFMRSDPDVIVLGEVRDDDTARNMIKAADTGHLVLATLHTGSIVGAVSRLRDLGVPPRELRYLLRSVLVQTLVRTLCTACNGTGEEHDGRVCRACNGARYAGRTVVSECEYFEDPTEVDNIINSTEKDVKRTWPTMAEDAIKKMDAGLTDEYELTRVFGAAIEPYLRKRAKLEGS